MAHKITFYSHKAGARRVRAKHETADIVAIGTGPGTVSFTAYVGDRYMRVYVDRAAIVEAYDRVVHGQSLDQYVVREG